MDRDSVVKIILQKGFKKVDLSMFSDEDKTAILEKVSENYLRQGKINEMLEILETINTKAFAAILWKWAEQLVELGEFEKAASIYEKLGEYDVAGLIRKNLI